LIEAGRVIVDGRPAALGDRLSGNERVLVDGKPIRLPSPVDRSRDTILIYHKPVGEITTRRDPENRKTVFEGLPKPPQGRWIAVGRLDIGTSGLLLFTTDGELAHGLMHPSYEIEREYAVRLRGDLEDDQLAQLAQGVELEDGHAKFESIEPMQRGSANAWYRVRLKEGRNREVRRVFEALGITVSRLIRLCYGSVELGRMRRGSYRYADANERSALYAAVSRSARQARR
jgi:23S rRNA pseudouridine2605 synthase